jgi:AraC-like DNA-binding protein
METTIPGLSWEELKLKGFKVHALPASSVTPVRPGRHDFYKMGLVNGEMTFGFGGQVIDIKGAALVFINPKVTHSILHSVSRTGGYACIFTENFISTREMQQSPLFRVGDKPVVALNKEQALFFSSLFQKMLTVYNGDYLHKADLIKSCISLVIHEAMRIQPSTLITPYKNGTSRITHLFMDLLERQFPIEQSHDPLKLRSPQDFAVNLAVHINYLNRAVKEITGKPTSAHIAARITLEAKELLQHTNWSVADIAYALGFAYPAYFNNYFKRNTGITPSAFRKV